MLLVAATRIGFFTLAYFASWFLEPGRGAPETGLFGMWDRWDAHIFMRVAEGGYSGADTDPHSSAFFPALPLALRGLHAVGIPYLAAGLVIATVATVVATAYLYRLADEELGDDAGRRAALYLLLFPTAVFLIAPYSEPLFLAGAIPAFYYARRGRWGMVALPAALAMASRAAGLFLLFGLGWEFARKRDFGPKALVRAGAALGAALIPLVAYGAFLAHEKGDALHFFDDQRAGWGRTFVGPIESLQVTWRGMANSAELTNFRIAWAGEIVAAAVGIAFVVWALQKREWGYAAYMGVFLAALVTSSWYYSIPRMLLSLFPIPLFLAEATRRRPGRHETLVIAFCLLASFGVIAYTGGRWFY
jgi:hypothetical protein